MDPEFIPVHQVVAASVRSWFVPLSFQVWEAPFTSPVFWGFLRRWIDHLIGHCQSTRPGKQW